VSRTIRLALATGALSLIPAGLGPAAPARAQGRCDRSDLRPDSVAAELFADSAAMLAWLEREWPAGSGIAIAQASFDSTGASRTFRVFVSPELPLSPLLPAEIEGVPFPVRVQLPVTFNVRR
jgi:hypothetical protein